MRDPFVLWDGTGTSTFLAEHDHVHSVATNECLKRREGPRCGTHEGFTTKDSGKRAEYSTGMVRDTREGKPRYDLILREGVPYQEQLVSRWAALMARGAEKYGDRNWEKARTQEEMDRFKDSAFRHFMQWICGETDEDHAAAVVFNVAAYETTWYLRFQDAS